MKKVVIFLIFSMTLTSVLFGHGRAHIPPKNEARRITFPDTTHYLTIIFDPHTHSVFSDGHVWPRIRVGEALRDGLDAIAITEHLEYQPHLEDIPHHDRNRSYEDAVSSAEETDLIIVPGVEITRRPPASHMNAIFINDANTLVRVPDPNDPQDPKSYSTKAHEWPAQKAVEAANEQGAFVFWNHSWWRPHFPNGITIMPDFHRNNAKTGLLHGIEIVNGGSYSEESFQIALEYNLTLIGTSDIHGLIDWDYEPHKGGHRPVTLVFVEERTMEGIRDAMFKRRTVVWFKNILMGRADHLGPLLEACLSLHGATYGNREILSVDVTNFSDADFHLRNKSDYSFSDHTDIIVVPQHSTERLRIRTGNKVEKVTLEFEVLNALTTPKKTASIALEAKVE